MSDPKKVRLGIIGVGGMGSGHVHNILSGSCPEIDLTAVADINPARLDAIKELKPDIACFGSAEELMDSGLVDAILIATPHYFHPPYAMEGFKRGLHVMSEKPAGVYTKQVKEMNAAAEKSNVVFGMMFCQRTNPLYQKMREIVQSGKYGEVHRTNWIITDWYRSQAYYDSGSWRATWSGEGGGVLLNQCPHQLDLWQWICGMPVKVKANMSFGKWHDIEVEDDVTAYVEYANGATGAFITSTGDFPGDNRFEVTLDKAQLICEGGKLILRELETPLSQFTYETKNGFPWIPNTTTEIPCEGKATMHVGVLNAFAGAILRGEKQIAEGVEGINGLSLSNAMHLSAWLGKDVSIPFDDDLFYDELMKRVKVSRRKPDVNSPVWDLSGTFGVK